MADLAAQYEKRYPGAVDDTAQKEERMQRILFKEEKQAHRRSGRNRGIIVPRVPWADNYGGEAA